MRRPASRLLVLPACLALGAGTGLASVAVHQRTWGLPLAVVASFGTALALLPAGWWARLPFCLGWVGVLLLATVARPEGDYLVSADGPGYALLVTGGALLLTSLLGLLADGAAWGADDPPMPGDPASRP